MKKKLFKYFYFLTGSTPSDCFIEQHNINPLKLSKRPIINPVLAEAHISDSTNEQKPHNQSLTFSAQSSEKSSYSKYTSTSSSNRLRREIEPEMLLRPENLTDARKLEIIHLDCKEALVKCINFNCRISNMARKTEAFITIHGLLGNKTLMEAFPRVDTVRIYSNARVSISSNYGFQMNTSDDYKSVSFKFFILKLNCFI